MKIRLKLTHVGMNMEEATIVKWHKIIGDTFNKGDILCEYETEKVTSEVEAQSAGKLTEILVGEGDFAEVGQDVCVVETS